MRADGYSWGDLSGRFIGVKPDIRRASGIGRGHARPRSMFGKGGSTRERAAHRRRAVARGGGSGGLQPKHRRIWRRAEGSGVFRRYASRCGSSVLPLRSVPYSAEGHVRLVGKANQVIVNDCAGKSQTAHLCIKHLLRGLHVVRWMRSSFERGAACTRGRRLCWLTARAGAAIARRAGRRVAPQHARALHGYERAPLRVHARQSTLPILNGSRTAAYCVCSTLRSTSSPPP